jgi:hypothetical protein
LGEKLNFAETRGDLANFGLNNFGLNVWQGKQGLEEFEKFAYAMLRGVIEKREREKGVRRSNLRTFCCMDVSVFKDEQGRYQHVVTDLEAGPGAGLFLRSLSVYKCRIMFATMKDVWRTKAIEFRNGVVL